MAEDVIDIRKRIEEMRNEVSSALADGDEVVIPSAPAGEVAILVPGLQQLRRGRPRTGPDKVAMQNQDGLDGHPASVFQLVFAIGHEQTAFSNRQLVTNVCLILLAQAWLTVTILKQLFKRFTPPMLRSDSPNRRWWSETALAARKRVLFLTRKGPVEIILKPSLIIGAGFVGIGTTVMSRSSFRGLQVGRGYSQQINNCHCQRAAGPGRADRQDHGSGISGSAARPDC